MGHDETAVDPDGTSHVLGDRGTDNTVWLYVREGANRDGSAFAPTGGISLTSPLVVSGDRTQTMVFDFTNKVGEELNNTWQCGCDAPTMSFR